MQLEQVHFVDSDLLSAIAQEKAFIWLMMEEVQLTYQRAICLYLKALNIAEHEIQTNNTSFAVMNGNDRELREVTFNQ